MPDIALHGCTSRPLAAYLKALGILRITGEQLDKGACGFWRNGLFVLSSDVDRQKLCDFFLTAYIPTPVVTPWNGGSGFYPGDNREGIDFIAGSENPRLAAYRATIARIRNWPEFRELGNTSHPGDAKKLKREILGNSKAALLQRCRAQLPECCLPWLDAASILTWEKPVFAPLLGTGGNEGRLEYSNTFMRSIARIFSLDQDECRAFLAAALFGEAVGNLPKAPAGQFDPGHAGGCNQAMGPDLADAPVNPWDFLLLIEGSLLFAGTLVRRGVEAPAEASFPFCVRELAAGFASSSLHDQSRGELWMPLWSRPASLREVRRTLGEGRASVGRCQARNGLDFASAMATLGVERGIDGFERYSLLERRGQSYVALPAGRLSVRFEPRVALLEPIRSLLEQRCLEIQEPSSLAKAKRRLAAAVFACTRTPDAQHFQAVSRALAQMDSLPGLPDLLAVPCPGLSSDWIGACDNARPEVRLAAALASLKRGATLGSFRAHLAPVSPKAPFRRWDQTSSHYVPWRGTAAEGLGKIFLQRLLLASRYGDDPLDAAIKLAPGDLVPLLEGRIDWNLLQDLARAFSLVEDFKTVPRWREPLVKQRLPHAVAVLKLLYTSLPKNPSLDRERLHPELRIPRLIQAGRLEEACSLAAQRLRVAGACGLYLPASFAECVRSLSPTAILACLAVPVDGSALLHLLHLR